MTICRLCLYKGDQNQMRSVLNSSVEDLVEKIYKCVEIKVSDNDNLPTSICIKCVEMLRTWEDFKATCHKSNQILNKSIKVESPYEVTDLKNIPRVKEPSGIEQVRNCQQKIVKHNHWIKEETFDSEDDSDSEEENQDDFDTFPIEIPDTNYEFQQNIYNCEICPKEFDDCMDFIDHQDSHDGEPVFKCDKCSEVFSTRESIVEHDRNHRTACPICGKMIFKGSMKNHKVMHTDRYKCTMCNHRFNSCSLLTQHNITVHTDIRDHICETCGKRFATKTAMKTHLKSHSEDRKYQCKICSYAGKTSSSLYIHMATHANDFCICQECSKSFKSLRNLNDHLRRVHSKEKPHICNYCNKKFVHEYMLRVHLRYHTGVRPYKCTLCDKAFIRSDGLKEHMLTHGQRPMFDCTECHKQFTSKRGVTRHNCAAVL